MLIFKSNFIGHSDKHLKFYFKSDSEEKYIESLKTQPQDWEYRNLEIDYNMNSYGHRCKDVNEIDLSNYILFAGCSFVEGVGLPEHLRYSTILSNLLNCDMYNLGLGGTGNDIIFYNLMTWFATVKEKPKLVIIQWTEPSRFTTTCGYFIPNGPWSINQRDFLVLGDQNNYFNTKTAMYKQMVRTTIDVPVVEIQSNDNELCLQLKPKNLFIETNTIDLARDLMHPGIKSNYLKAQGLLEHIQTNKIL